MLAPTPQRAVPAIVELRLAEAALRENQENVFHALSCIGDAVITADMNGRVVRMNAVAEQLTGWSQGEASGRRLAEVFRVLDELSRQPIDAPVDHILRSGVTVTMVHHALLIGRDGLERPIVDGATPLRDAEGNLVGVALVFRDITAKRWAEEALFRSQRDFREVIEKTLAGVAICLGDQIVYANPSFASSLGYPSHADLVGKALLSLLHAEERDAMAAWLRNVEGQAHAAPGQARFVRVDGELATLELAPVQLIQFEGAPAVLLVARDVTQTIKMQTQLQLADRLVSVGTLAAGVAHEINNPLACVMANLDYVDVELGRLTKASGALGENAAPIADGLAELAHPMRDAREAAERVRLVVRDVKTFSRADDSRRGPVNVHRVLDSAINMARNEIRHRAQLHREYGDVPPVEGNDARLGQVFLNLIVNAAQAIPEGNARSNEIRVVTRCASDRVTVEIRDTGVGIKPELRRRIFDPFFTTKPFGVGTGLGLSICLSIVSALGGTIEVESEVGRGTVFRVTLQSARWVEPVAETPSSRIAAGRRGRILFVDDEPMIGNLVRRALGGEHEVVFVTSAQEALDQLAAGQKFDLVFCDLMMPDMTGMDLYGEMTRLWPAQREQLVFLTGGAFTQRARDFLNAVPNARLEKPFDMNLLRSLIRERLL